MSAAIKPQVPWLRRNRGWLYYTASMVALVAWITFMVWIINQSWPGQDQERALCDREVHLLLTSRDPVELQRADILIRRVRCNVRRRVRDWEAETSAPP